MAAYRDVLAPRLANVEHTAINCTVFIEALGERVPFTARADDTEAMGREIFAKATAGLFGPVQPVLTPALPVPDITRRQFYQALAVQGRITKAEAVAAMQGVIPAVLLGLISGLAADDAFAVQMLLSGATVFERGHPLTTTIGAAQDMDDAQVDNFFRFAGSL